MSQNKKSGTLETPCVPLAQPISIRPDCDDDCVVIEDTNLPRKQKASSRESPLHGDPGTTYAANNHGRAQRHRPDDGDAAPIGGDGLYIQGGNERIVEKAQHRGPSNGVYAENIVEGARLTSENSYEECNQDKSRLSRSSFSRAVVSDACAQVTESVAGRQIIARKQQGHERRHGTQGGVPPGPMDTYVSGTSEPFKTRQFKFEHHAGRRPGGRLRRQGTGQTTQAKNFMDTGGQDRKMLSRTGAETSRLLSVDGSGGVGGHPSFERDNARSDRRGDMRSEGGMPFRKRRHHSGSDSDAKKSKILVGGELPRRGKANSGGQDSDTDVDKRGPTSATSSSGRGPSRSPSARNRSYSGRPLQGHGSAPFSHSNGRVDRHDLQTRGHKGNGYTNGTHMNAEVPIPYFRIYVGI
eukprot:GHVU01225403.1.p1 GENE.GHVU01225403.1~~GHVU01225403.1.p1  ORF type:complete len:410 (-),score=14.44 GHVU01225403.1:2546-3775(-)